MMKNPFRVMIITCWILLVLCLILKLFGANWFDVYSNTNHFMDLFNFIDNHKALNMIVMCIVSLILNSIVVLAILEQKFYTKIQFLVIVPIIILTSLSYWFSQVLNFILGFAIYLTPIIWLKKRWYRSIIGIVLIMTFELISLVTKNIGNWALDNSNSFVTLVLQIDTLILSMLYYLYSNKKNFIRR